MRRPNQKKAPFLAAIAAKKNWVSKGALPLWQGVWGDLPLWGRCHEVTEGLTDRPEPPREIHEGRNPKNHTRGFSRR